ncbi:hypothetical protein NCS56_01256400 [Fusarium sp. Ph1]|nr:hypothetical protein NCS56_01256400 [Fusarium sp. Ph1]
MLLGIINDERIYLSPDNTFVEAVTACLSNEGKIAAARETGSNEFRDFIYREIVLKLECSVSGKEKPLGLSSSSAFSEQSSAAGDSEAVVSRYDGESWNTPSSTESSKAANTFCNNMKRWLNQNIVPFRNQDPPVTNLYSQEKIKIAIIDSGASLTDGLISAAKEGGRIKRRNFLPSADPNDWNDVDGHGTIVTSLLLEHAPNAEIYVANVTDNVKIDSTGLFCAINWAIQSWKVDIISMSFVIDRKHRGIEEELAQAIDPSYEGPGISRKIVFAAAGNSGGNSLIGWPAKRKGVIAIHATDGLGTSMNINPNTDNVDDNFATLGRDIETKFTLGKRDGKKIYVTGTSYATPIAAAIAANVLEFSRHKLLLTSDRKRTLYTGPSLQPVRENETLYESDKNDSPGRLDIALFCIEGSLKRLEKVVSTIHRATTTSLENRVLAYAGEKRDKHFEQHVDRVLQYGRPELRKLLSASVFYRHYRILHERRTDPRRMFALERFMGGSSMLRTRDIHYPNAPIIFKGQKKAVCPICKKSYDVEVLQGAKWRSHVDQDLKPYVCISQHCSKNLLFFADRTSWIRHMRQVHTAMWIRHLHNHLMWKCALPHDRNIVSEYPTKESLLEHMKAEHQDICEKDEDLTNLASSSGISIPRPLNICPICGDEHSETGSWMNDDYNHKSNAETPKHEGGHGKSTAQVIFPQDRIEEDQSPATSEADCAAMQENRDHQRIERYIGKHLEALSYYFCHYLIAPPSAEDNWIAGEEDDVWGPLTPVSNEAPSVHEDEEEEDPRGQKRKEKKPRVHETPIEADYLPYGDEKLTLSIWREKYIRDGPFVPGTSSRSLADVRGTLDDFRRSAQYGFVQSGRSR